MSGIWALLLLIFTAVLPAIIVFLWFKAKKSTVTLPWFLASFAAGIISLSAAALIQRNFPFSGQIGQDWLWPVLFSIFVRVALVEELSRLIILIPLLKIGNLWRDIDKTFAAALGFAAGLGFGAMENAVYGMADINITLLRILTAAPLHGACGIRAGRAVSIFSQQPAKAIFLVISAVLIHGTYNLMIVIPTLPSGLAILVALGALFASLSLLGGGE